MPSASSPIAYPSSPVANLKRPHDQDVSKPKPNPNSNSNAKANAEPNEKAFPKAKPRVTAGFVDDDSDDESVTEERPLKRRALDDAFPNALPPSKDVAGAPDYDLPNLQDGITTPPDSQPRADSQLDTQTRLEDLLGAVRTGLFTNLPSTRPFSKSTYQIVTCSGKSTPVPIRAATTNVPYESMVAARSRTKEGRAKRSYYGIDIHELVTNANKELAGAAVARQAREEGDAPITPPANADKPVRSVEDPHGKGPRKARRSLLWTEKYRARNFADLVGDDLTNRQVLRWLKRWDPIVFPHAAKRPVVVRRPVKDGPPPEEKPLRKILMLTGPPGLGKTTLAHVCARQAGYEVLEINASDDRSSAVVKGRIRTSLGTESVKTVEHKKPEAGRQVKVARPVCVVVDEVDGVVTGAGGGGEGGFVKALIDLVVTDQKNSAGAASSHSKKKKKGDDFRQMRPLILICNDVYAPSLRPLRQSGLAEVIHVGKPSMDAVVARLKSVFEKEGIPCDKDAARKLCEAAWGMTSGIDAKRGAEGNAEGDLRGIMVVGEMVASRLKAAPTGGPLHLTRQWVEKNIMHGLAHGGGGARGLGRGGTKEIVTRVFQEGAGFPKQALAASSSKNLRHEQPQTELSFSEQQKKYGAVRLAEMVETCGEVDRIVTDVFLEYPNREYNDDSFLTKPDTAYEWLHFHDTCSTRLYASQEWELGPYLSQPVLACHNLFASPKRHMPAQDRQWGDADEAAEPPVPFSGPRADFEAREAEKANRAVLQGIQAALPPSLHRAFRSPEHVASDFLPYLVRLVSPDVKPVVVGGGGDKFPVASVRRESERAMVRRAASVLAEVGIELVKGRIEAEEGGLVGRPTWVYRMDP